MTYGLTRTVAPGSLPISAAEVRNYLRIDGDDDDVAIGLLIAQACEEAEAVTGRALVSATYKATFEDWPRNPARFADWPYGGIAPYSPQFLLPRTPLVSVTSVQYYAEDAATLTTLSTSAYRVITDREQGFIELVDGETWPDLEPRSDAVQVTFVAGSGSSSSDVPAGIRQAMLLLCRHYYAGGNPNTYAGNETDHARATTLLRQNKTHGWTV